jgi:hypothetical protein
LLQFLVVRQQSTLSLCCARCQPTLHRERTAVADSAGAIFHDKHHTGNLRMTEDYFLSPFVLARVFHLPVETLPTTRSVAPL